jgi:hypothetical protein
MYEIHLTNLVIYFIYLRKCRMNICNFFYENNVSEQTYGI